MKKLLSMILALALLLSAAAGCASAEAEWTDYTCAEQQFSTKIPVSGTSGYDDTAKGLKIYTDVPGYIPFVIVSRRPMDKKFSNPENYLNNVYREYLEDKYGDDYLGMFDEAGTWEIGGKQVLGARFKYRIGEYTVVHLQLIEVREAGDVEYTAKYIEGEDEATLAALNEAVRNYRETDAAPAAGDPEPAGAGDEAAVPSFLTPSEFVSKFNSVMEALADKYADQLGEEGVKIVKEEYTIVQEDIQGAYSWYGNRDWSIEVGFVYADEGSVSINAPALQLNFNIKAGVPDAVRDFAVYSLKMMIAYEYQNDIVLDDLYTWFSTAEEPGDIFTLPGYELSILKNEEFTKYMFLIPADSSPFRPEE